MARSLNGTTQRFLNTSAAPFQSNVGTIAARVNFSSVTPASAAWIAFMGAGDGRNANYLDITSASVARAVTIDAGGTAGVATHGTTLSTGVLYGIVGVFSAQASRTIYVNELTPVTDTTDIPLTNSQFLFTSVGFRYRESVDSTLFLSANLVQDVAYWDVALTANEVAAFMRGVSPRFIRPGSLKEYFPMLNSETSGGNTTGLVGSRMVLSQAGSPPLVNPAPALPFMGPRFGHNSIVEPVAGGGGGGGSEGAAWHHWAQTMGAR